MGYYLQSCISTGENLVELLDKYSTSSMLELEQNINLILLTEDLFDQICKGEKSEVIKGFEYLTVNLEEKIKLNFSNHIIGYIEASYWGGEGDQSAIIWKDQKRILEIFKEQNTINKVLRFFGVVKDDKKYDEFDTLKFGLLDSDRSWDSY